jgi:hypothetical protein
MQSTRRHILVWFASPGRFRVRVCPVLRDGNSRSHAIMAGLERRSTSFQMGTPMLFEFAAGEIKFLAETICFRP